MKKSGMLFRRNSLKNIFCIYISKYCYLQVDTFKTEVFVGYVLIESLWNKLK